MDILRQDSELSVSGSENYLWLIEVRKLIIKEITKHIDDLHILEKYKWLTDYYNKVVTDKETSYPVPIGEGKEFRETYEK